MKQDVFQQPRWTFYTFLVLVIVGIATLAFGLVEMPQRAWTNVLVISNYLLGLATGSLVLVALHYVTGARWSVPLRRIPEALTAILPIAGLGLVAVLLLQPSLYSWASGSSAVENHSSALRALWLEQPFFVLRALTYILIWLAFAWAIVRNSRQQDQFGDLAPTARNRRLSAAFLVVFGITCWLASNDWLMSLEANWSSTVFGVYNFAGLFLSALAAVTLLALWLRQFTLLRAYLTADRLHDLGTLLFAFSSFWMYIWFCQYLLIWYTNHREETIYLRQRLQGPWPVFLLTDLSLNWGIPFVVLLFRAAKRNPLVLASISLVLLAGRWVDLCLMIAPSQGQALARFGFLEAGIALGAIGIVGLVVCWALRRAALVPMNEPFLTGESRHRWKVATVTD